MASLDLDAPSDDRTPDLALSLLLNTPARSTAPSRDPVQGLVQAAFDTSYEGVDRGPDVEGPLAGVPGDLRGEFVQGLAADTARLFGTQYAAEAVRDGRIAEPTNAVANDALATVLGMPLGQRELLPSGLTGSTPERLAAGLPLGSDLVVLHDQEAAAGLGHTAVLIGNDVTGWTLHSKDGSAGWNPTRGEAMRTNEEGRDRTTGGMSRPYPTLDDFFRDEQIADRYEAAVRVEFNGGADQGPAARASANAILREPYMLGASSCAHVVEAALARVQANPAYGISGFDLNTTALPFGLQTRPSIVPDSQFATLQAQEGGDDVRSEAQVTWAARSAPYDPD